MLQCMGSCRVGHDLMTEQLSYWCRSQKSVKLAARNKVLTVSKDFIPFPFFPVFICFILPSYPHPHMSLEFISLNVS